MFQIKFRCPHTSGKIDYLMAATGVHPATMMLWFRKRYLKVQVITLIYAESQLNGRNYIKRISVERTFARLKEKFRSQQY